MPTPLFRSYRRSFPDVSVMIPEGMYWVRIDLSELRVIRQLHARQTGIASAANRPAFDLVDRRIWAVPPGRQALRITGGALAGIGGADPPAAACQQGGSRGGVGRQRTPRAAYGKDVRERLGSLPTATASCGSAGGNPTARLDSRVTREACGRPRLQHGSESRGGAAPEEICGPDPGEVVSRPGHVRGRPGPRSAPESGSCRAGPRPGSRACRPARAAAPDPRS